MRGSVAWGICPVKKQDRAAAKLTAAPVDVTRRRRAGQRGGRGSEDDRVQRRTGAGGAAVDGEGPAPLRGGSGKRCPPFQVAHPLARGREAMSAVSSAALPGGEPK